MAADINWVSQPLGESPDGDLAAKLGCPVEDVARARAAMGIPSYAGTASYRVTMPWDEAFDLMLDHGNPKANIQSRGGSGDAWVEVPFTVAKANLDPHQAAQLLVEHWGVDWWWDGESDKAVAWAQVVQGTRVDALGVGSRV